MKPCSCARLQRQVSWWWVVGVVDDGACYKRNGEVKVWRSEGWLDGSWCWGGDWSESDEKTVSSEWAECLFRFNEAVSETDVGYVGAAASQRVDEWMMTTRTRRAFQQAASQVSCRYGKGKLLSDKTRQDKTRQLCGLLRKSEDDDRNWPRTWWSFDGDLRALGLGGGKGWSWIGC